MNYLPAGSKPANCLHYRPKTERKCDQPTCVFYLRGGTCRNEGRLEVLGAPAVVKAEKGAK